MRVVAILGLSPVSLCKEYLAVLRLLSKSVAAKAIIVNVLPRPIGSAMMPPQNCGGSSSWWLPDIRLTKLHTGHVSLVIRGASTPLTIFPGRCLLFPKCLTDLFRKPNHFLDGEGKLRLSSGG